MTDLPGGWKLVTLKDITKVQWGNTSITKKSYVDSGFPAFSASGSDGFLPEPEWSGPAVILSAIGARCGKCFFADGEWTAIKNTIVIQGNPECIDHRLLHLFLNDETKWEVSGTGQPFITMGTAKEVSFPLPPFNEQKRIVEKLEKLLAKVGAAEERLDKIPVILKRFRQSVLAAASSGKLTADWRGNNGGSSETETPPNWTLMELGSLFPKGGIFDGPFGSNLKSSDYIGDGVRVVRLENVGHLRFLAEKASFVSEAKYETLKKHSVGDGDIIFSSFIGDEVRACILPDLKIKAIAKADCFCLRPNREVNSKYLLFQLVSRRTYDELVGFVHGATRPRINTTQLKTLMVPICPLEEQKEIVRRVEELFKFADQIEERFKKARSYTDKLTQSLLAKAFRGELVPQDPLDEPASTLLQTNLMALAEK